MRIFLRLALGLTAACGPALSASPAAADSSIGLIWEATGTPTITVSNTVDQVLEANLVVSADLAGITAFFVSFRFDSDLGDELDIATPADTGCTACIGNGGSEEIFATFGLSFQPVFSQRGYGRNQVESTSANAGLMGTFESFATGSGIVGNTVTVGSVLFKTNASNVSTDGVDVEIVVLPDLIEGILNTNGDVITSSVVFTGARVNQAPSLALPAWTWAGAALAIALGSIFRLRGRR